MVVALTCLAGCSDSETVSKSVISEMKPHIEQLARATEEAQQGLGSIRKSLEQELNGLRAEVKQVTAELASTRSQFSGIIAEQQALLVANQKQLISADTHLKDATLAMESLRKSMVDQDQRIAEMVAFYKDRKFIVLNTLGGEKLETTGLPQNALGEVEVIDGFILALSGYDQAPHQAPIEVSKVKALGAWKINGKDYHYADEMTFTVEYRENVSTGRVATTIRDVTFINTIGQVVTQKASGWLIDNDGTQGLLVPGYQKSVKLPHPTAKGRKFTLLLSAPLPVTVK